MYAFTERITPEGRSGERRPLAPQIECGPSGRRDTGRAHLALGQNVDSPFGRLQARVDGEWVNS